MDKYSSKMDTCDDLEEAYITHIQNISDRTIVDNDHEKVTTLCRSIFDD